MRTGTLVKTLPTAGKQLIGVVIDTEFYLTQVLWNNGAWGWYKAHHLVEVKCE